MTDPTPCPRGCVTRCHATNAQPCDNPRYQDSAGSVTSMLQQFLINRHRANPVDRNESAAVTTLTWERIKAACADQLRRANAWSDPDPAKQLTTEDVSALYPPIVHAAGVMPVEVEQAVTAQINQRETAAAIAAWVERYGMPYGMPPLTDWQVAVLEAMPPPGAVPSMKVTVECGPTPGWLDRLRRRLFG